MERRKIFNFKRLFRRSADKEGGVIEALSFGRSFYSTNKAMTLSTVYRCVNCISDAVAQLPLNIYRVDSDGFKVKDRKSDAFSLLNVKPNPRMTRYTFISLLVQSMLLDGNGYAHIKREKGKVVALTYIPSNYVSIVAPQTIFEEVKYEVNGIGLVEPCDMIHLVNQTFDGVIGVSTLHYARLSLGLAYDSERHAANFFSSGCGLGGILKSVNRMRKEDKTELKESWREAVQGAGANGVVVLDGDADYKPLGVNPADSQLLETRQFNVIDICRFFGVSPVKAFDLSKSSYSTVEATNIGFLTDTLSPLLEKIELEFETKLFGTDGTVDVRFDESRLLRADKQSQASYYNTLFQVGAISPNEIRRELDLPVTEGGDSNFVQVNLQTLKKANEPQQPDTVTETNK